MNSGTSESKFADLEGPLLERIRRALAHDLRTPLGTISNYAAILEYHGPERPEDVRVFASRIRASAAGAVTTLQQMTEAIALARSPPAAAEMDPAGTLRALVAELSVHVKFPARGDEPGERVSMDPELITFAWRAFLSVSLAAASTGALDVDLAVEASDTTVALDMFVGPRSDALAEHVSSERFARAGPDSASASACFALGLAEDLVRMRGGDLVLWGRPGSPSGMRIRFPRPR